MKTKATWLVTVVAMCLLVPPPAGVTAASASQASAAKTERQLKKLRRQVKRLSRQVASLTRAPGPTGPQGAEGPPGQAGTPGPQGPADGPAGGDLTGSYPNPEIREAAVGSLELDGNAIRHDTSTLNTVGGNFTSKIGPAAIGRNEIADGEVRAPELGTIVVRSDFEDIGPNDWGSAQALCAEGEQLISGGADWPQGGDVHLIRSAAGAGFGGWAAYGQNDGTSVTQLAARAYCLA